MNEILAVSLPQTHDDLDIYEDVRLVLITYGFTFLDMKPEYNTESIIYRFQRQKEKS